jgi:ketosteroid isomerase-like protein
VAEWQTRRTQNPLVARPCGFDSLLRHQLLPAFINLVDSLKLTLSRQGGKIQAGGCAMKIARVAALAVFLAMPLLAHGQAPSAKNDKAVQEVVAFRNRYIEAEENRDMAFLDKILADDFFALNPQGKLLDKAGQLENLKRPDRTLKVLNPRETHVQFYANGDVAILTEHVTVDGVDKGKPFGGEYRFLRVFAKQNGAWKVVLAQGSPMPEQKSAAK